jgi:DNA helicase-2/ATP-dependent DNA helicase PcrA
MQRRAAALLHQVLGLAATQPAPVLHWAGTFHSLAARLLREYALQLGLAEAFTIADRGDAEDLMGLVRQERGLAAAKRRFPLKGTCLAIYSRSVNSRAPLASVLSDAFPWCAQWKEELRQLFGAYVAAKQAQHTLDYDDLLLYWSEMMANPQLAGHVGSRFDHVLVDEYQDTNRLQAAILLAMKPDGRGLTVVGDDAQSIYSFRAAEVRNMLDFPAAFDPPGRVLTLERNYRSTQPILEAANAVIALASEQFTKRLWSDRASSERPKIVSVADDAAQASWVADRVLERRECGCKLKSQAVLFRASHHSAAVELELMRRGIPFVKFGGLKLLEAAHIKDVLAVLRWAENPRSRIAGFRVAQLVPGIGPATARRVLDALATAADPAQAMSGFEPAASARHDWRSFTQLYFNLRGPGVGWPAELDAVIGWYAPHLERLYDDARVRQADLAQLARIATGYSSRERFLTELTLDPPQSTSDESADPSLDEDYLILSTIHSAKGQEWQAVYVLNVVDGCMPADLATGSAPQIEEERRLLYVAMTRARQHLELLVPQRFYVTQQAALGDRHMYGSLTRFITPAVAAAFESVGPRPEAGPHCEAGVTAALPLIDIGARARAAWG